jgi:hypothetical protein
MTASYQILLGDVPVLYADALLAECQRVGADTSWSGSANTFTWYHDRPCSGHLLMRLADARSVMSRQSAESGLELVFRAEGQDDIVFGNQDKYGGIYIKHIRPIASEGRLLGDAGCPCVVEITDGRWILNKKWISIDFPFKSAGVTSWLGETVTCGDVSGEGTASWSRYPGEERDSLTRRHPIEEACLECGISCSFDDMLLQSPDSIFYLNEPSPAWDAIYKIAARCGVSAIWDIRRSRPGTTTLRVAEVTADSLSHPSENMPLLFTELDMEPESIPMSARLIPSVVEVKMRRLEAGAVIGVSAHEQYATVRFSLQSLIDNEFPSPSDHSIPATGCTETVFYGSCYAYEYSGCPVEIENYSGHPNNYGTAFPRTREPPDSDLKTVEGFVVDRPSRDRARKFARKWAIRLLSQPFIPVSIAYLGWSQPRMKDEWSWSLSFAAGSPPSISYSHFGPSKSSPSTRMIHQSSFTTTANATDPLYLGCILLGTGPVVHFNTQWPVAPVNGSAGSVATFSSERYSDFSFWRPVSVESGEASGSSESCVVDCRWGSGFGSVIVVSINSTGGAHAVSGSRNVVTTYYSGIAAKKGTPQQDHPSFSGTRWGMIKVGIPTGGLASADATKCITMLSSNNLPCHPVTGDQCDWVFAGGFVAAAPFGVPSRPGATIGLRWCGGFFEVVNERC